MMSEATPIPRRYGWLKRLGAAAAVLLIALIGLRWYWGYEMGRRLDAAVAAIEARGEPIHFNDMRKPPVPDADNKVAYLRQALANWPRIDGLLVTDTDWYQDPDQHDDPITDNAAYLARCEVVFDLLRQGAAAPATDWGVTLSSPAFQMHLPHFAEMRHLGRLVDDAAERAHDAGDHRRALHLVDLELSIADTINGSAPTLLGHLVDISIRAMAATRIQQMLPTLPPEAIAEGGEAGDVADRLIARLLDEDHWRKRHVEAMVGERWGMHDTAMSVVSGRLNIASLTSGSTASPAEKLLRLLIGPQLQGDALLLLNVMTAQRDAAEQTGSYPEFRRLMNARVPNLDQVEERFPLHPLAAILLPAMDAAARTEYAQLVNLRMAATALAIRQYEAAHGRRPTQLDDLVPRYLAAVPRDPFADDGRAIGYRAAAVPVELVSSWDGQTAPIPGAQPIGVLSSVGYNGVDDGGQVMLDPDYTLSTESSAGRDGYDQVFPLDPLPERPTP